MLLGFDSKDYILQNIFGVFGAKGLVASPFKNKLIEILTGEGKSITLGITSALLALLGYRVDVVCYSKYLSERDYDSFSSLFYELGLKNKIFYGTFDDLANRAINENGDLRKLSESLITDTPVN